MANTELSQLQIRAVFRQLGYPQVPADEVVISADHCLKLWVFMLLNRLKFLASEQRTVLFEELVGGITGLVDQIQARDTPAQITPMVVIADSRYAAWHGVTGWLDLQDGSTVPKPRQTPLEIVSYNLAVLFNRNQAACEELQRAKTNATANRS